VVFKVVRHSDIAIDMRKKVNMPQFLGNSQTLPMVPYKLTTHMTTHWVVNIYQNNIWWKENTYSMSDFI